MTPTEHPPFAYTLLCAAAAGITFENCIETDFGPTSFTYRCKNGLWAVTGTNQHYVRGQALHYWLQYLMDGEYGDVVSLAQYGPPPTHLISS